MIVRFFLLMAQLFEWLGNKWLNFAAESRIRISCVTGEYWAGFPPMLAKLVKPQWYKTMVEKAQAEAAAGRKGVVKFNRCPGMHDYLQEGYLILAHTDIHIKANGVGISVTTPLCPEPNLQPVPMDFEVVDGMAPIATDVVKAVTKVSLPYGIYLEPGHSAHLLPPLIHADYLDKIFVYPGTVDYDTFHVANFIFSCIKPCEFTIKAGTPLLHVLPFKRVSYHGTTGPATKKEVAWIRFGFPSRAMGFYRRMFHSKKVYTNEVIK
jgi:hypothetical protein